MLNMMWHSSNSTPAAVLLSGLAFITIVVLGRLSPVVRAACTGIVDECIDDPDCFRRFDEFRTCKDSQCCDGAQID